MTLTKEVSGGFGSAFSQMLGMIPSVLVAGVVALALAWVLGATFGLLAGFLPMLLPFSLAFILFVHTALLFGLKGSEMLVKPKFYVKVVFAFILVGLLAAFWPMMSQYLLNFNLGALSQQNIVIAFLGTMLVLANVFNISDRLLKMVGWSG